MTFDKKPQGRIDEAMDESFPASDAPAWNTIDEYQKKSRHHVSLECETKIDWERNTSSFDYSEYNREANLVFQGGEEIQISNPSEYFGNDQDANSETLFVAAISSCYMQTFLGVASLEGYTLKRYWDRAVGQLDKDEKGNMSMTEVVLNLALEFEGIQPSEGALNQIKEKAKQNCFIANSTSTKIEVRIEVIS